MLLVSSAHDNSVNLFGSAIFECAHLTFNLSKKRLNDKTFRPVVVHGVGSIRTSQVLASILIDLRSYIFSGVGGSDNKNAGVGEFTGISEIVGVKSSALELLNSFKVRHVGNVEVTSACNNIIELFSSLFSLSDRAVSGHLSHNNSEVIGLFIEDTGVNYSVKVNPVFDVGLFDAA